MAGNETVDLCIVLDEVIKGYTVCEKIDEGNFGQVFIVSKNKQRYAMKVEPNRLDGGPSSIKVEIEIMAELQTRKVKFVPGYIEGGKALKFHYIVMELLNDNLKKLRMKCPDPTTCTPGTWSRIGIQCLYVLKSLHDTGYVHRDLKPANFAMGPSDSVDSRVLHVLDFGISRKFVKPKEIVAGNSSRKAMTNLEFRLARRKTQGFKGTPIYASLNAHAYMDLGRVDDVWSLIYMIAEMVKPLSWGHLEDTELVEAKKAATLKELFNNIEGFEAVEKMLRRNNYYTCPDYDLVFNTFRAVYSKSGCSWMDPYDWETKQLVSYQKWKILADARTTLFPWEYSDVSAFFQKDVWKPLMLPIFKPEEEKLTEKKKKTQRGSKKGKLAEKGKGKGKSEDENVHTADSIDKEKDPKTTESKCKDKTPESRKKVKDTNAVMEKDKEKEKKVSKKNIKKTNAK